jgi:DNA polymerase-1
MIRVFQDPKGDIHIATAMMAFGIDDPKKIDKDSQRDPSKAVNFGVAYGGGPDTLYDTLALNFSMADKEIPGWLSVDWCAEFIDKWFGIYPGAKAFFDDQHARARRYGFVWCPFGRIGPVPEVRSFHERVVQAGLRQGPTTIIGMEAGLVKVAQARVEDNVMTPFASGGIHAEAVLPMHDELISEVDAEWAEVDWGAVGYEMACALDNREEKAYAECDQDRREGDAKVGEGLVAKGKQMQATTERIAT